MITVSAHVDFDAAYRTHRPAIVRQLRRLLAEDEAEQVAQETFIQLWEHPERFDARRGSLATYLHMTARSRAVDHLRSIGASQRRGDRWANANPRTTPSATGDGTRELVRDALLQLPEEEREAIVRAFFGGATYVEVAAQLGLPEGTVKSRIRTGLRRLRSTLEPAAETA